MILRKRRSLARGFSLAEMSIVLATIGVMGVLLWKFLPNFKNLPAIVRLTSGSLSSAEDALNGFILAQGRLPCPASVGNGLEDCSTSANLGWLPSRTLGLNLPEPVRYGVYRVANVSNLLDTDFATLKNRYTPLLPPGVVSTQSNGLDFCQALLTVARAPGNTLTAGQLAVPIVYGLAVAGTKDADGNGSVFDGRNQIAGQFEGVDEAHRSDYDDSTRVVGAAEMLTRLGCAARFSATNGAARAAYAAYDINRFTDLYQRFRVLDEDTMQGNLDSAVIGEVVAIFQVAISAAAALSATLQLEQSKGLSIATLTAALVSTGLSAALLVVASVALAAAKDALTLSTAKRVETDAFKLLVEADFDAAVMRVLSLDEKGLLP